MAIIVDTSIWIDFQRLGLDPREQLSPYLSELNLHYCGIIRAEVTRGLRNPEYRRDIDNFFDIIPEVPTTASVWRTVADLAWTLDRKGIVLPVSDLVIAASALEIGAAVVTTDEHFRKIPKLRVLKRLP